MPIYEYICEHCEEELEVIQKISDEPLTLCPSCNKQGLKKKTSMSAFHLKGGGWYKDGYGNSNSKEATNGKSKDSKTSNTADSSSPPTGSKDKQETPAKTSTPETKTAKAADTAPKSKAS